MSYVPNPNLPQAYTLIWHKCKHFPVFVEDVDKEATAAFTAADEALERMKKLQDEANFLQNEARNSDLFIANLQEDIKEIIKTTKNLKNLVCI